VYVSWGWECDDDSVLSIFLKKTFVLSGLITNEKLLIKQTFNLLRQCNTIFTFSSGTLLDWALINIVLTGNVIIRVTSCCISHVFFFCFVRVMCVKKWLFFTELSAHFPFMVAVYRVINYFLWHEYVKIRTIVFWVSGWFLKRNYSS